MNSNFWHIAFIIMKINNVMYRIHTLNEVAFPLPVSLFLHIPHTHEPSGYCSVCHHSASLHPSSDGFSQSITGVGSVYAYVSHCAAGGQRN